MLDAVREAQAFAASRSRSDLDRLVHGYFDIDLDIVWSTVTDELPPLAAQLERALASAPR